MKILTIANQKGGVGKTALVVNLAWYAADQGKRVAVIDLDVQGNCSFTLKEYEGKTFAVDLLFGKDKQIGENPLQEEKPKIVLFPGNNKLQTVEMMDAREIAKNLITALTHIAPEFDLCLIDSPAAFGGRFMAGLLAAEYVLAPIELEAYSIQGIKQLVTTFGNARKMNERLSFLGILANKVDRRNLRHKEHLKMLSETYAGVLLLETVGLRASIAESLVRGKPVWTSKKTAARMAAREIKAVAELVFRKMGL